MNKYLLLILKRIAIDLLSILTLEQFTWAIMKSYIGKFASCNLFFLKDIRDISNGG